MSASSIALALLNSPAFLILVIIITLLLIVTFQPKRPGMPPIVAGYPILGSMLGFMKNPFALALQSFKTYGDVFTITVLNQRLTFLVGPHATEYFFKARDEDMNQKEVYKFSVSIFGPGVIYDVEADKRVEQFRFMTPALKGEMLKAYVPDMSMEAEMYFNQKWGDCGVVDLREALSELIILTASRCLMGPEIRENLFGEVSRLFQTLDEGLLPITFFLPNLPIHKHRARDEAREQMAELFSKVLRNRRANPGETNYNDMLDHLMYVAYRDGTALTDREIAGLMISLLFAGQHTSSVTSSWTGLLMIHNKAYLEKARKEQEEIVEKHGSDISYDALMDMEYLHYGIREALRLFPPLIFVMRKAMRDFAYNDGTTEYVIPKGDLVFVSPPVSHRDGNVFADPERYDPYRFAPPRCEDKSHRFAYQGFGGGRHGCLGEQFAMLQIKTIWSVLLRKYDFSLEDPLPEPDYTALVVGPKACRVRYKLRSDN